MKDLWERDANMSATSAGQERDDGAGGRRIEASAVNRASRSSESESGRQILLPLPGDTLSLEEETFQSAQCSSLTVFQAYWRV